MRRLKVRICARMVRVAVQSFVALVAERKATLRARTATCAQAGRKRPIMENQLDLQRAYRAILNTAQQER